MKTPVAIAALVVATITVGAALPAFAQDASSSQPPAPPAAQDQGPGNGPGHRMGPMGGPGGMRQIGQPGLLALACSDKGAGAMDKMFDRTDKRLDLSADQQKLFDAFKTKALAAEATFAGACQAARPDRTADQKPDLLSRMKAGLAIDQARLTAMTDVLPDFEALYNSLNDDQKAHLLPHRRGMGGKGWNHDGRGPDKNGAPPPAPSNT